MALSAAAIDNGRPPATFPLGRVCSYFGCTTKLSIYNQRRLCSLHGPIADQKMGARKN